MENSFGVWFFSHSKAFSIEPKDLNLYAFISFFLTSSETLMSTMIFGTYSTDKDALVLRLFWFWFSYPWIKGSTLVNILEGLRSYYFLSIWRELMTAWNTDSFSIDKLCNLPTLLEQILSLESLDSTLNPLFNYFF